MPDLSHATFARLAGASLENAARNRGRVTRSVTLLSQRERVLVVANGPSLDVCALHRSLSTPMVWPGVVCADGALPKLVAASLSPDLVVSCDPHPRIAHWFGAEADDYFARVGEAVPATRRFDVRGVELAIATASHPRTVDHALKAGMSLYWWNAMLDDPRRPGATQTLYESNGMPCLNGGGNVGTAAWVLAHQILKAKDVGLVGFDFGYPPDFPVERTQYWPEIQAMYGERWREAFTPHENGWYSDPTMAWFWDVFHEMAKEAPCRTVNCGEGGTLGIERMALEEFLK